MTEAEWLGCGKPVLMVRALGEEASARKLQLFAVVVLQGPDGLYPEPETHLVMAERFADGLIGAADLRRSWGSGAEVPAVPERAHEWAEWAAIGDTEEYGPRWAFDMMARFVREVFGNPFRPVAFATDWRTDTALALARQMYEACDFSAMPILADALQDAGCDDSEILDHCRGDGPHVRGCWVVDLVLGKT